ncbi:MAG: hypothetical protein JO021_02060 [Alphaproteobacteria bacterium]|nr:hypothetical protein [Alphaproteobacteria bacterium]
MLIIEQNIKLARTVADRFLILREGKVAQSHDMRAGTVTEEEIVRSIYL